MALNMKKIIADALLGLCDKKGLEAITIQDLLDETSISRQTFYNHFKDKNDLIQYVYETRIIVGFKDSSQAIDFEKEMFLALKQMKKYQNFMKQACLMDGQNCLKDYIFKHCQEFDLAWHTKMYGKELPDALRFATIYHASASSNMTLSWVLSDMVVECEKMAKMITEMRAIGMDVLFKEGQQNPYHR